MLKLYVGWLERDNYVDGGCWALFTANGHLWAELAQKGRNVNTYRRAAELATLTQGD